jgi:hypothetical protein
MENKCKCGHEKGEHYTYKRNIFDFWRIGCHSCKCKKFKEENEHQHSSQENNNSLKNPFKNYKQALNFILLELKKKTMLSNFKPTDLEWALFTLSKSKIFLKKLEVKDA